MNTLKVANQIEKASDKIDALEYAFTDTDKQVEFDSIKKDIRELCEELIEILHVEDEESDQEEN